MKLSKAKLIKLTKPGLVRLGFKEFKDTKSGAQGLFCKKINSEYYLTLALTIHRYYYSAFVGEFTFSKCTTPYLDWGDMPKGMNIRLGHLLTPKERSFYHEDEFNISGASDIWWDGNNERSVSDFLNVVELTESRMINQTDLILKINQSKEINILAIYSKQVKNIVSANQVAGKYSFSPIKEVDDIPLIWFNVAEMVLKNNKDTLNYHTVIRLASDAYRQDQLDKTYKSLIVVD